MLLGVAADSAKSSSLPLFLLPNVAVSLRLSIFDILESHMLIRSKRGFRWIETHMFNMLKSTNIR